MYYRFRVSNLILNVIPTIFLYIFHDPTNHYEETIDYNTIYIKAELL